MRELYDLPKGWEWKNLSYCVLNPKQDIVDGPFGSNLKASEYTNSGIPIIRLQNIDRLRFIDKDIKYISKSKAEELKRHSYQKGDLVITKLGMPLGKCCTISESNEFGIIVADIVRVRINENKTVKKFIEYAINSNIAIDQLSDLTKGTTRPRVNLNHIRDLKIPLPLFSEQQRIVAKLDLLFQKIDKSIELHKKNMDEADAFMGSVLNEVFGELEEKYGLSEVGKVTDCIVPQRNKPKQFVGDIPWITTDDLKLFKRISKSTKCLGLTREDIEEVKSKTFPKESVLMSCVGDLGVVAIANAEIVVNQQLHTYQCKDNLLNTFLMYALYVKKDYMYQIANITTVAYMNKTKCNSIPIPLPPLRIQHKVVNYLGSVSEKMEKVKSIQKEKMESLKALKASILDKAFRGEL